MVSCLISPFFHSLHSLTPHIISVCLLIQLDPKFFFVLFYFIFFPNISIYFKKSYFMNSCLRLSSIHKSPFQFRIQRENLRDFFCLLLHLFQCETVNEHLSFYFIILQCFQARFVTCFIVVSVVIHKV